MPRDWTIDTLVLYHAADGDWDAVTLLNGILTRREQVAFDIEGSIEAEYRKCLMWTRAKPGNKSLAKWLASAIGKLAFTCCGKLDSKHKKKLLRILEFHEKDCPFVGVCSHTQTKNLVSEDSHYSGNVKNYLADELKISVLSIKESLNLGSSN